MQSACAWDKARDKSDAREIHLQPPNASLRARAHTHTYGLTATAHTRDFVSIFIPVDEIERECVRGWLGEFVM